MNAYVIVGFVVAYGVTALYSAWTVLESRRIAAQVLAVEAATAEAQVEHS
jgi:hypothetical protein